MDATRQIQVEALKYDKSRRQIKWLAWHGGNQLQRTKASLL